MWKIAIFGLDTFRHKNLMQIIKLNEMDYTFDVFTSDILQTSTLEFVPVKDVNNLYFLKNKLFTRIWQITIYLQKNKKQLHHIEVYIGGRFQMFYLIIAKIFRLPTIIIERGDIQWVDRDKFFNKLYSKFTYRLANVVYYKEPYMKELLIKYKAKRIAFIPNSILVPDFYDGTCNKRYGHFLWVNRLTLERRVDRLLKYSIANDVIVTLLGIDSLYQKISEDLSLLLSEAQRVDRIEIINYAKPFEYYKEFRFFILDSDFIYGNYALLEAMSYGVVPIVRYTKWNNLIIKNGINGFEFDDNEDSFKQSLDKVLSLSESEYQILSDNARATMLNDFSALKWLDRVNKLYKSLDRVCN